MKKLVLSLLLLSVFSLNGYAQSFQKSFGMEAEQQELYSICNNDSESLLVSGTFKNFFTFPEINFYGTVSKVNKTGEVQWYKGYLPTDFVPFEAFLITSVLKADNGDTFTIGSFLSTETRTGYILMRLNSEGEVLFAKKINDQDLYFYPKAVLKDDFVYVSLYDKIVKFDLNGEIIEAKKFEHLIFRDINLDQNNNIILTGEYGDPDPNAPLNNGCPILILDGNLQLISGNIYTTDPSGFYGESIISTNSNQIIVGGPSAYFSANPDGQVAWAMLIPQFSTPNPSDGYNLIWDLQKNTDGTIMGVLDGFYADSDSFQHYSAICKIDPATGLVISSKDIKAGHFDGINHIEANNLLIDNDNIYVGGTTGDYDLLYKLNYLHKTGLNDTGCGEVTRSVQVESWANEILPVVPYQSSLIATVVVLSSNINMIAVDIPINYDNQSCNEPILSIDEPTISSEIVIYPNPFDDILTINSNNTIEGIKVFDILGKEMQVIKLSETSYDFSQLSKGVYIIQIKDIQNQIVNHRVLKK